MFSELLNISYDFWSDGVCDDICFRTCHVYTLFSLIWITITRELWYIRLHRKLKDTCKTQDWDDGIIWDIYYKRRRNITRNQTVSIKCILYVQVAYLDMLMKCFQFVYWTSWWDMSSNHQHGRHEDICFQIIYLNVMMRYVFKLYTWTSRLYISWNSIHGRHDYVHVCF